MSLPMTKAYYDAQAFSVTFGTVESTGNQQIAVGFEIVHDADFAGETITWIGFFTDKTVERTIESLLHMGWQGEDPTELADLDRDAIRAALPEVVSLTCEPDEYNGEYTLKVRWVNKPGGGRFAFKEPLQGNALKAFGAQLRNTVRSVRASGGAPRQRAAAVAANGGARPSGGGAQPHPNAPGNRNDIPFVSCALEDEPSPIARVLRPPA